jgi:hypothetical protein
MRDQRIMNDNVFIDTILEAQAILARHIAGEHASAEETIAKLMQLLDSTELVKALIFEQGARVRIARMARPIQAAVVG